jgi:hypothetical protein
MLEIFSPLELIKSQVILKYMSALKCKRLNISVARFYGVINFNFFIPLTLT